MKPWLTFAIVFCIALVVMLLFRKIMRSGKLQWPVNGHISSKFGTRTHPKTGQTGSFHNGIDIAAPIGTAILSPADGEVVSIWEHATGGLSLKVNHTNGFSTGYAHLHTVMVGIGDQVKKGQVIAQVGNSGASTGPHLHFTLRDAKGDLLDPEKYLG